MHAFAHQPSQPQKAAGLSRAPPTIAPAPPKHHGLHVPELVRSLRAHPDVHVPGVGTIRRKAGVNDTGAIGTLSMQRLQAKLTISQHGDPDEQEADRIAGRVMTEPASELAHAKCAACSSGSSTCPKCEAEKKIQPKALPGGTSLTSAPPVVHEVLRSPGQALPSSARSFFEPRFGADFSQVRVYTDAAAQRSAQDVNANAYTAGHNIVFGTGRFAPETQEGRRLLAHELTHVVQQSAQGSAQIVQRQMCTDILNAEEVPGVTRGVEVERLVRVELISLLGGQNIIPPLPIPGASSRKYRMEDCGGFQSTQPAHQGTPDLAFRQYPRGRTLELAEVKIGTWPCLLLAEQQVDNYVDLADKNEDYKRHLGVDHIELMPTSRFTPPQALYTADGTPVAVGWCSPGVIVYKAVANSEPEEPEEKPKDKEPKDKEPGPGDSIPEQLLELGKPLARWLAEAGLLDIGLALGRVMLPWVAAPLAALAAVVLGIAYFWDEIKSVAGMVAGVAKAVWDKIVGLHEFVRGVLRSIRDKLYELGVDLAHLVRRIAGEIASFVKKLAEGAAWVAGRIAAGAWWLGGKIASGAEAFWDWLWDSDFEWPWGFDVEPIYPNIEMPVTEEPTQHCATVAYEDTIVRLDADLLFPFNESELEDKEAPDLKAAAKRIAAMRQKDDWIRFEGYTDIIGGDDFNKRLSERRAEAVANWFVEQGFVPASRVRTEGYGRTKATAKADDEEGRKKDRRVDIWLPGHGSTRKVCW